MKVSLKEPLPLNDETLKKLIQNDLDTNQQPYLAEVAKRYHLDLKLNHEVVLEKAYEEQFMLINQQCIANTLDENTIGSYVLLQNICYFNNQDLNYIKSVEGENWALNMVPYVENRLENVQMLKPLFNLTNVVNEAMLYLTDNYLNFSSYKANQLKEKLENTNIIFSDEEKAKLYFISSKLYRKLNVQNKYFNDNYVDTQEKDCLDKVLSLTSDYKLISYCQNRLGENNSDKKVIRAYKKALTKKQTRNNSYKINNELANIYFQQSKKIGYLTTNSDKAYSSNQAIKYYMEAYRYAQKEDRLPLLKKMTDVYLMTGKKQEWKNVKEVIAMKFLKGQARCAMLNSIGDKTDDITFYFRAIEECKKSKLSPFLKLDIMENSYKKLLVKVSDKEEKQNIEQQLHDISLKKMKYLSVNKFCKKNY